MFITQEEKSDIFNRLRTTENDLISQSLHDTNILEKLEDFKYTFEKHDKLEMIKYDKIQLINSVVIEII